MLCIWSCLWLWLLLILLLLILKDTGRTPDFYDLILTGDRGYIGKEIVIEQCKKEGYDLSSTYNDCGVLIFDKDKQDTHSGGSGCACIATVFSAYVLIC